MVQCRHGGLKLVPEMDTIHLHWQRLNETEPHHEQFPVNDDFPPAYRREIGDFAAWITENRQPCLTWIVVDRDRQRSGGEGWGEGERNG